MSGDRGALIVATVIAFGVAIYGIAAGSAAAIGVGVLGFLIGGAVLKVLG
jgi:hypothetical protein